MQFICLSRCSDCYQWIGNKYWRFIWYSYVVNFWNIIFKWNISKINLKNRANRKSYEIKLDDLSTLHKMFTGYINNILSNVWIIPQQYSNMFKKMRSMRKPTIFFSFIYLLIPSFVDCSTKLYLRFYENATESSLVCNDGSPGGYYIR